MIFWSSVACFHLLRDFPVGAHSSAASMTRMQKYEFFQFCCVVNRSSSVERFIAFVQRAVANCRMFLRFVACAAIPDEAKMRFAFLFDVR